jgi:NAD(P)-dependent dehydrogenase (short-subunit alcohol dehydrogenase family)
LARLENKVVLLSGGASGIGAATARLVLHEGGKAVLADRDEVKGRALAQELGKAAVFVPLDVTDEAAWQKAVAAAVEAFGSLHGLLNAAGIGVRNSIEDCTLEEYRRVNDINSMGTFLGCKHAIPAMRQSGGGSIVNISSVLGLTTAGLPQAAYASSKAGLIGMTRDLAQQWTGRKGIRVNALAPGFFESEMTEQYPDGYLDLMRLRLPAGRAGDPAELAATVVFLASDAAGYITGQTLAVDGGMTIT